MRKLMPLIIITSTSLLVAQGCSSSNDITSSSAAITNGAQCEGLDPDNCLLPWPSSRFLVRDKSTATGYRVSIPSTSMPQNVFGDVVDPSPWNRWDGFSPMTSAMAQLPVVIDPSSLVDFRHVERSLTSSSPTILLDATTGELVAHFAEVESASDADPTRTTLYVRPAQRLEENHDYVVAFRKLAIAGGGTFDGTTTFRALRDHQANRAGFEADVFAPLKRAGISQDSLSLAWDFHTASGASGWGDLVAMQKDASTLAGSAGLGCKVTSSVDPGDGHTSRQIDGTITVPTYLDNNGLIARDGSGTPQRTGTIDVPFTAIIPRSVAAAGAPARLVTFEHGLFSDRTEMLRDFMVAQADTYPMVMAATDLSGFTSADVPAVAGALFDVNGFTPIFDQVSQSVINTLLLPRTLAGACSALPEFQIGGTPVIDGSQRYYYGISQGGNLGPTFAALSDDMDRFVFGVGGISYPIMITRSVHWPDLAAVLAMGYPSRIDRDTLMVMFAHQWDRVEGSTFAPHVLRDPLVGKAKRVLAQDGLYDVQTPNEGSHLAARTLGLPQASYDVAPVWGLTQYASDSSPNAYVTFDAGVAPVPESTVAPMQDNGVHEGVRRDPRAQKQIDAFLRPNGFVTNVCNGPCTGVAPVILE